MGIFDFRAYIRDLANDGIGATNKGVRTFFGPDENDNASIPKKFGGGQQGIENPYAGAENTNSQSSVVQPKVQSSAGLNWRKYENTDPRRNWGSGRGSAH